MLRAAAMAYGDSDPVKALSAAAFLPESRLQEMLALAPVRPQLDAEALLDARRASRRSES